MRSSRCIERGSGVPERSAGPIFWIIAAYGGFVNVRHMRISFRKAVDSSLRMYVANSLQRAVKESKGTMGWKTKKSEKPRGCLIGYVELIILVA